MSTLSNTIPFYDKRKQDLVEIYKICPLSGLSLLESTKLDLHHLYSQHKIIRQWSGKSKLSDNKEGMSGFIHSFLNLVPVDHDKHIQGVGSLRWDDVNSVEYKKMVIFLQNNQELIKPLNFEGNQEQALNSARIVFEEIEFVPWWFTELY